MPKDYYNEQLEGKRTRLYVNVRAEDYESNICLFRR